MGKTLGIPLLKVCDLPLPFFQAQSIAGGGSNDARGTGNGWIFWLFFGWNSYSLSNGEHLFFLGNINLDFVVFEVPWLLRVGKQWYAGHLPFRKVLALFHTRMRFPDQVGFERSPVNMERRTCPKPLTAPARAPSLLFL